MSKYKGIYIDDDESNHRTYSRLFSLYDIELLPYSKLKATPEEYCKELLELDIDFIIIDFDFSLQGVNYTGIEVLQKLRNIDKEIYIIYLTAKDFQEEFLGDFDIAINKRDLEAKMDIVIKRLERALSRDLSIKMEREIDNMMDQKKKYFDEQIALLKDKLGKI